MQMNITQSPDLSRPAEKRSRHLQRIAENVTLMKMNGTTSPPLLSDHMTLLEEATCRMTEAAHLNQFTAPMSSLGAFLFPNFDPNWSSGFPLAFSSFSDISVNCGLSRDSSKTPTSLDETIQDSRVTSPSLPESTDRSSSGSVTSRKKSEDRTKYKTELCKQFSQNQHCSYGSRCTFAHGTTELRPLSRHKKFKTQFCREYHSSGTNGYCPYGSRCHFLHEEDLSVAFLLKNGLATRDPCTSEVILLPKALELLSQAQQDIPQNLPHLLQSFQMPFTPLNSEP